MLLRRKNKERKPLPDYNPIIKHQKEIFIVFTILLILGGYLRFFHAPVKVKERPFLEDLKKAEENFKVILQLLDTADSSDSLINLP